MGTEHVTGLGIFKMHVKGHDKMSRDNIVMTSRDHVVIMHVMGPRSYDERQENHVVTVHTM
jgi:hypothetical protein